MAVGVPRRNGAEGSWSERPLCQRNTRLRALRGTDTHRPDSVHNSGGFWRVLFSFLSKWKTSKNLPIPSCSSGLSAGGREARREVLRFHRRSQASAQGAGDWEPRHGPRGARALVTAPYQNCSRWNMGSSQMKKHTSEIKTQIGEAVTLITLWTSWNGL